MIYPDIRSLVPHAGIMVLLDRVISVDAESLCAEVMITSHSLFYEVTGDKEGVGAWVGIEYMAQAIAAYAGYHALRQGEKVSIGFLVGTRNYQCNKAFFEKGCILKIHIRCILQADNGISVFECTISDADTEIASATLNTFLPDGLDSSFQK